MIVFVTKRSGFEEVQEDIECDKIIADPTLPNGVDTLTFWKDDTIVASFQMEDVTGFGYIKE